MKKIILFIVFIIASSTIMATNYYVTTVGNDGNNGSAGSPWKSVYKALSVATSGDVVNVGTGTFTETNFLMVPTGVSIIGTGSATTTINVNKYYNSESFINSCGEGFLGWETKVDQYCMQLMIANNQLLKGFSMNGQNRTCHGAVYIDNGVNVVIDDLNIKNFKFSGIWMHTSQNSEIKNCYLQDNCIGTINSTTGNILIYDNKNLLIHDNVILETGVMGGKGGYGIKAFSKTFNNSCWWEQWDALWAKWADGTKIYNNSITVPSEGTWLAGTNAVPDITIEINLISAKNVEIYNNYLTNHISLIGIKGTGYDFTSFNVHNNYFDLGQTYRYTMEADAQGIEFHHNYINGGYYPIAQWGNNTTVNNLRVHHNVFYAPIGGQALMHVDHSIMKDLKFYNNTVVDINGVSKLFYSPTGSYTNADIRNNLFIASAARGNYFTSGISSGTVANNGFQNINTYGSGAISGDMLLINSGSKPAPYFTLQSSSPAINAGVSISGYTDGSVGNPDMGAFENGVTAWTCGVNSASIAVTGVTVTPTSVNVAVAAATALVASVLPTNATNKNVTWSSGNTSVATVSSTGVVTGVAGGTVNITVTTTDGNKTATCAVTVTGGATGITVPAKIEAENYTAMSGVQAENTTDISGGQNIGYIDQNDWMDYAISVPTAGTYTVDFRVASVNSGRQFQMKVGSTILTTVTVPQTGGWQNWQTITASVNLSAGAQTIRLLASNGNGWNINWFEIKGASSIAVTGVTVTPTTASVVAGATTTLTASVAPSNATNKNVTWTSGNTGVATVSTSGIVTGVAAGTATITVTTADGNKTASCAVTVTATNIAVTGVTVSPTTANIVVGATSSLTATVAPANATNKNVTWSSGNTSVATVNSSGIVTGVAAGSVNITVTTTDGNKTATCAITVVAASFNIALNKTVVASTIEGSGYEASKAVDGNGSTRWASASNVNTAWIYVDLGAAYNITRVVLNWEAAYATGYQIQTSGDAINWTSIYTTITGNGGIDDLTSLSGTGRYVRMNGTAKGPYDYSLYEFEVYGTPGSSDTQAPTIPTSLGATDITTTTFILSWAAATDNVGVIGYDVYKGGVFFGNTASNSINVTGLSASTNYGMTVRAKDAAGNVSAVSTTLSVKSASINTIQAENYNSMSGITNKTTVIGGCDNSDYVVYNNIDFTPGYTKLVVRQACDPAFAGQKAEFRLDGVAGTLIGTCTIVNSGNWTTFVDNVVTLSTVTGIHNLYVVFISNYQGVGDFDYFRLTNSNSLNARSYVTNNTAQINAIKETPFNIYPNPVHNRSFIITVPESSQKTIVSIVDLRGKIVYQKNYMDETKLKVNMEGYLSAGLYIIKVVNGSKSFIQKLIIN